MDEWVPSRAKQSRIIAVKNLEHADKPIPIRRTGQNSDVLRPSYANGSAAVPFFFGLVRLGQLIAVGHW